MLSYLHPPHLSTPNHPCELSAYGCFMNHTRIPAQDVFLDVNLRRCQLKRKKKKKTCSHASETAISLDLLPCSGSLLAAVLKTVTHCGSIFRRYCGWITLRLSVTVGVKNVLLLWDGVTRFYRQTSVTLCIRALCTAPTVFLPALDCQAWEAYMSPRHKDTEVCVVMAATVTARLFFIEKRTSTGGQDRLIDSDHSKHYIVKYTVMSLFLNIAPLSNCAQVHQLLWQYMIATHRRSNTTQAGLTRCRLFWMLPARIRLTWRPCKWAGTNRHRSTAWTWGARW